MAYDGFSVGMLQEFGIQLGKDGQFDEARDVFDIALTQIPKYARFEERAMMRADIDRNRAFVGTREAAAMFDTDTGTLTAQTAETQLGIIEQADTELEQAARDVGHIILRDQLRPKSSRARFLPYTVTELHANHGATIGIRARNAALGAVVCMRSGVIPNHDWARDARSQFVQAHLELSEGNNWYYRESNALNALRFAHIEKRLKGIAFWGAAVHWARFWGKRENPTNADAIENTYQVRLVDIAGDDETILRSVFSQP